jgi:hypothetical protein
MGMTTAKMSTSQKWAEWKVDAAAERNATGEFEKAPPTQSWFPINFSLFRITSSFYLMRQRLLCIFTSCQMTFARDVMPTLPVPSREPE